MPPIEIQGSGPFTAPLLVIGEVPGKTDVLHKTPFQGMPGKFIRSSLRRSGLDPDRVRFNNAVPISTWVPADHAGRAKLLRIHAEHLDTDLIRCEANVIVVVGGMALQRIAMQFTLKDGDWPTSILLAHGGVYETVEGKLIIPCLEPLGVFRGKIQSERLSIERVLARAVRYATGQDTYRERAINYTCDPPSAKVDEILAGASTVCIDTEFDPSQKRTFLIGFTTEALGAAHVWSLTKRTIASRGWPAMQKVLRHHLGERTDLLKVAHHHFAEVDALRWVGIHARETWFDTLYVHAALYPDLPRGLSHLARFYLDDVRDWKGMAHDDPRYNAIDVITTWRIYEHERQEITDAGMWDLVEKEILPTLPMLYGMQQRGIMVDKPALLATREANEKEIERLRLLIQQHADSVFSARKAGVDGEITTLTTQIIDTSTSVSENVSICPKHPTYYGLRGKKFAVDKPLCICEDIFNKDVSLEGRTSISALRKEITKLKTKSKKWATGFDPGNNDHLRWLLYDKAAFGLRIQKDPKTKRPTANATAIAKLLALKSTEKVEGASILLVQIKRVQHLEKMNGTFLNPPIEEDGCVHPQYRMVTGTGRPASGADEFLAEKGDLGPKFNALNIPNATRRVYVPHNQ
jgi:uracil-DNA glycosylase family 4